MPLHHLHSAGYTVLLTGHSLGAGVAAVLASLLRPLLPGVRCIGFATPSSLAGEALLEESRSFVTSVILRCDAVPRATIGSCRRLLHHLADFDSHRGGRIWSRDLKRDGLGLWQRAAQQLCGTAPMRPVNLVRVLPAPKLRAPSVGGTGGATEDGAGAIGVVKAAISVDVRIGVRLFLDSARIAGTTTTAMAEGTDVEQARTTSSTRCPPPTGGPSVGVALLLGPAVGLTLRVNRHAVADDDCGHDGVNATNADADGDEGEPTTEVATAPAAAPLDTTPGDSANGGSAQLAATEAAAAPSESAALVPTSTGGAPPPEEPPPLHVPGRVLHLYHLHGVYRGAWLPGAASDFAPLSTIRLAPHMLSDHKCDSYLAALKSCRSAMHAPSPPPRWVPYDEAGDTCACCASPFAWEQQDPLGPTADAADAPVGTGGALPSTPKRDEAAAVQADRTARSAAQQACARHHCRACGRVVCDGCSRRQQCLPQFGICTPARCCDACFFRM